MALFQQLPSTLHPGVPHLAPSSLPLWFSAPGKARNGCFPRAAAAAAAGASGESETTPCRRILLPLPLSETLRRHSVLVVHLAASAACLIGFCARPCALASVILAPPTALAVPVHEMGNPDTVVENTTEDEELLAALEAWKSKTYALTVPLKIVSLRGSLPPSWIKDFIQAQGRRLKLSIEYRGGFESIFSDLAAVSDKGHLQPKSAMAADIIAIGDSWLNFAIAKDLIVPIKHIEEQDWFKTLSDKWKVHLCRNDKGELDPNGCIWGAPYRWGTMVIAYKKNKFRKHNLKPIEDWSDLWRDELAGKISMVDSSREVIGAVLKYMGASYNTKDIEKQASGGRKEVLRCLRVLQRQVRVFDSVHYLKAFSVGDVWVAVGWSSDVIPVAKRMSNVAVIVPKSGSSIWADLWVIPSATRFKTDQIGGRVRGPSPLIHQWIEFCLQIARALPFHQEVIPGASPFAIEHFPGPRESIKGRPKLDTNLVDGAPTPEILAKCEFLEPLSEKAREDFEWLISSMDKPGRSWVTTMQNFSSALQFLEKVKKKKVSREKGN
ncbi:hypothetical protein ZIOFF_048051 [Zingiber officinale]|uniref:Uncharacterized protein n=1 Tax=Zingiber officinale TaxID=94328 RepID=A0A8J5G772_ZINOF|nr:hypothetical protein ZIOFF_048051 [Zingiber officinale]